MSKKENADLGFMKEKAANAAAPELPESLRPQEIEALITGKKQKKHGRPLRAVVSVAVAACVLLTSVFVFRDLVYAPAVMRRNMNNAGTAIGYKEVGKLINARRRVQNTVYFGGARKSADDSVAVEEAAGAVGDGAYSDSVTVAAAQNSAATVADHAETNVRTEGVLESDVIKTDGNYLYLLSGEGTELLIIDPKGAQREIARIDLSEGDHYRNCEEFYLLQNRLVILGSFYDAEAEKNRTSVQIYNITDPAAPVQTRHLLFDGYTVSSRVAGEKLMLVTCFYPMESRFSPTDYTTYVPSYNEEGKTACYTAEENLYLGASGTETGFVTVSLMNLSQTDAAPQSVSVFGSAGDIYCTGDALYVYDTVYPAGGVFFSKRNGSMDSGVKTGIQKYDVSGEVAVCTASGSVDGTVLNTFALDEADGYLRVAAGDWNENRVYVLDGDLKQVGVSDVLVEGENIRSVRFMGNYAYVVTFMQTDPLFVVDLSDPTAPKITGEVKLPGFSSYLHPAGEGMLLGLGYGGTETGLDGSTKLSLFDVSDPTAPKETDSLVFPDKDLNQNYKAFVTLPDGSFLIPYLAYEERRVDADEKAAPETEPASEPVTEEALTEAPASLPLAEAPEAGTAAEPDAEPASAVTAASTNAPVTEAPDPADPAPDDAEAATAVSESAAVTAPPDDFYAEEPIVDEYVWVGRPGVLHVKAENGRLILLADLSGGTFENRWPEVRASFIGDAAFAVSNDWDSIVVERFALGSGEKESTATYKTKTAENGFIACYD